MRKWEQDKDAVRVLQQALIDLNYRMPNSMVRARPGGPLTPDGEYGNETFQTVYRFQSDHHLRMDGVAGRETWIRLDSLFPGPGSPPAPAAPSPSPPGNGITVIQGNPIPHRIGTRGRCGGQSDDFTFNDYPRERVDSELSSAQKLMVNRFWDDTIDSLVGTVALEIRQLGADAALTAQMLSRFVQGSGIDNVHDIGTPLSVRTRHSAAFDDVLQEVKKKVRRQVREQEVGRLIDYRRIQLTPPLVNFRFDGLDNTLLALIGGTQGLTLFISNFNLALNSRTYSAVLRFEVCDHFGAGKDDILASPRGLAALWVLQHKQRNGEPRIPRPFANKINVNQEITDSF